MARIIEKIHINMKARPRLSKVMEKATCYLLEGEIAKSKREDKGELLIWAEYPFHREIIIDGAAFDGDGEFFRVIKIGENALMELLTILLPQQVKRKESTGRPVKYGFRAMVKARRLKGEGLSIRAIAKEMGASTYTVQRLLK